MLNMWNHRRGQYDPSKTEGIELKRRPTRVNVKVLFLTLKYAVTVTHYFLRTQSCLHNKTTFDLGDSSALQEHRIIHPAAAPSAGLFIGHHRHTLPTLHNALAWENRK